jgi:hypothetical protein
MLTARYRVEAEDMGAFAVVLCTRSGQLRRGRLVTATLIVCAFVVLGVGVAVQQTTEARFFGAVGAFFLVGCVFATRAWQGYPALVKKNMMRTETPETGATLFGEFTVTVSDEGLGVEHELYSSQFRWAGLSELIETPTHLFLMMSPVRGYVVPKKGLSGASTREFAAAVRRGIESAAAARK